MIRLSINYKYTSRIHRYNDTEFNADLCFNNFVDVKSVFDYLTRNRFDISFQISKDKRTYKILSLDMYSGRQLSLGIDGDDEDTDEFIHKISCYGIYIK